MGTESDADDGDNTFFELDPDGPAVSRGAFQLHGYAVINSIKDGHPGFVSDNYLNAIAAETTTRVLELETAGMWSRREDGYFVVADKMVKMAIDATERFDQLAAVCAARRRHRPSPVEAGWSICEDCTVPLLRDDGGPVALPDGGPLDRTDRDGPA